MRQRRFTLLPAAAFLVAWVPQPALAPPGSGPPGRPLPVAAARPVAMPATTSQPTLGFTVTPTTVRSGEPVVLAGSGCRRGQRVHLQWRPYPRTASVGQLAPATARGDGSFRRVWRVQLRSGQVAASASCGKRYSHEVVLTILGRPDWLPSTGSSNATLAVLAGALLAAGAGALWLGHRARST
jgi:LPXTG-motif cell wall-anchored protein